MSEHTPRPWDVRETVQDWEIIADHLAGSLYRIALVGYGVRESEGRANARLVAAAPELLDLAEHVNAMADDAYLSGHPEWQEIVREARALLDRIEGGE